MFTSPSLRLTLTLTRTHPLRKSLPTTTKIASIRRSTPPSPHASIPSLRSLHNSARLAYARKDDQDKDTVKPEATEYSKSGTDDGAAKQMDAAFDPSETSPEGEKQTAGEGDGDQPNPLEVSPANPDVSKPRDSQEGGSQSSSSSSGTRSDRKRSSGQGSPAKSGKGA